ncbi:serine/threonine-protein kinase pim-3-like isoform X2 [Danio rerio]|uniref:Serine/threonine-protein kinase pim-3-like isoform X2 n=1 Tax=Danio rerio TaxID=7955 RepID=A0AC58JUC0_DANRE
MSHMGEERGDQRNGKRKRQSSSQQTLSTSSSRPAKRSRRDLYQKGPLLGRGGFGSVFAGMRRSDGLPVAIKYVSKDRTPERLKVDGQGRLPLEVALMTRVTSAPACPSVLQLLDWFDRPRRYILILERPDPCQDLQSFCEENGCLDERLAKKVLVQLIVALKHCESRGVLHRDVKPENLLISTESQDIKLLDFGCGDLLKHSAYKYFAGTPAYAPPEWFRRHRYHATPATVWSVGVTLYNILCDRFPFRGAQRVTSRSRLTFPRSLSTGFCCMSQGCQWEAPRNVMQLTIPGKCQLHPKVLQLIWGCFGETRVYLFALAKTGHCSAQHRCTGSLLDSDMCIRQVCVSLVSLLVQTLCKVREDEEQILLVTPHWPTQTWFPELTLLGTDPP